MNSTNSPKDDDRRHTRRVPSNSVFYDKLFPILLIALGVLTVALIAIAAGVLLGIIQYR
jgi:hypothetical protein